VLDLVGKAIGDRTGRADANGSAGSGNAAATPRPGATKGDEEGPAPSTSTSGSTGAPPGRDTSDA
jgi:hypothetical protein